MKKWIFTRDGENCEEILEKEAMRKLEDAYKDPKTIKGFLLQGKLKDVRVLGGYLTIKEEV